jgi:ubiquinone/menaquinone biosynthesis C-methylase UbiE
MNDEREHYTMGYGPAATAIMAARTAQSHAAFFLARLKPGMRVLDCGCGPGTITLGFAERVAPGGVVGTEIEKSQVTLARRKAAERGVSNASFELADIYALPFEDASFDAVFSSAVLGNLREPVRGLRELLRVLRPGGIVGVKEFDNGGDLVHPLGKALEQYNKLYQRLRSENSHDPYVGRRIGSLLLEAGFGDVEMSACYESISNPKELRGVALVFAGLLSEGWGSVFKDRGWATAEDIRDMKDAWLDLPRTSGALYAGAWCEAIGRRPEAGQA